MKKLFLLFILITSISGIIKASDLLVLDSVYLSVAQNEDSLNSITESNIVDYSHKLALFLYAKQKFSKFAIYNRELDKIIEYSPNDRLNIGFGFNYKWLGIGLAFNFGFVNNDNDKYGVTKRLDWQTNIYLKRLVIDFYLQYYKGYYVQNPQDVFSEWREGDEMYIRPDIRTTTLGFGAMYILNHKKFSYKSAFLQTAIQKKSAGSFMIGGHFQMQGIRADSSFIPTKSVFKEQPPVIAHQGLYFGIITAYAYNFIIRKHYFASLSLLANMQLGSAYTKMEDGTIYTGFVPVFHLQPRLAIGVNRPKWYAGVSFVNDIITELYNKENKDWTLSFASGNYRIFLGYRFGWFSKEK